MAMWRLEKLLYVHKIGYFSKGTFLSFLSFLLLHLSFSIFVNCHFITARFTDELHKVDQFYASKEEEMQGYYVKLLAAVDTVCFISFYLSVIPFFLIII